MKLRRLKHFLWIMPVAFLILGVTYWLSNFLTDNFHTVIPGKIYRGAQMQPELLTKIVDKYHIRTVINLRGVHPRSDWYVDELAVARAKGIHHYSLKLAVHKLPERAKLQTLVRLLQTAPQPILVHCRQGADRTGLSSALGVILLTKSQRVDAKHQVSWYYNVFSPTTIGYQVLSNYFAWLEQTRLPYGKASFLRWLYSDASLKPYFSLFAGGGSPPCSFAFF